VCRSIELFGVSIYLKAEQASAYHLPNIFCLSGMLPHARERLIESGFWSAAREADASISLFSSHRMGGHDQSHAGRDA
jgi:hypothetical protein